MNILINFSTLKAGGGQNVAMNFLYEIFKINNIKHTLFYFVAKNSLPHKFLEEKNYKYYYIVSSNPIKRIFFEFTQSKYIIEKWNIDVIYSYFGFGLFPKKYKQIVGSADSNLYFPEINFWNDYKVLETLKRYLIDQYRIFGIKRADAVIFENYFLEERGKELFNLKNTITIKPSINISDLSQEFIFKNKLLNKNFPKGLFLCGWHLNKNILKIPEIAFYLKKNHFPFQFILTAPLDNSYIHKQFNKLVNKYNVKDMCFVIGQVNKNKLASLYQKIDYVFLLSKLESFSNNIIESWYFQKPLIISNEEWSKNICDKAAIYVDRENAQKIAKTIINLSEKKKNEVVWWGTKKLKEYPSIKKRIFQELEFIENV
jgi:glycosyltransferase involved in cell wall biosynthesis